MNEKIIETIYIAEMAEICAGLAKEDVGFSAVYKNGRWVITIE